MIGKTVTVTVDMEKANEYLLETSRPSRERSSVYYGNHTRFIKTEEQAKLKVTEIQEIIDYTNEFLGLLGRNSVITPKRERDSLVNNSYKKKSKN